MAKVVKFVINGTTKYAIRKWSFVDHYRNLHFGYMYVRLNSIRNGQRMSWEKRNDSDFNRYCVCDEDRIVDYATRFKSHTKKESVDYGKSVDMKRLVKVHEMVEEDQLNENRINRLGVSNENR